MKNLQELFPDFNFEDNEDLSMMHHKMQKLSLVIGLNFLIVFNVPF